MQELTSDITLQNWPHVLTKAVCTIVIAISFCALMGWLFYLWMPEEILSVIVNIKPNAAICFILAACAVWLNCENQERINKMVIDICSAIIFLAGFLTLFEYFFNLNLGVDDFFIKIPAQIADIGISPGRMTPITAVNFVLIGFTLFFLENKIISYRVHQFFILCVFVISLFEFLNHIYKVDDIKIIIDDTVSFTEMTFFSSLMFALLSLGLLAARPNQGLMTIMTSKNSGGKLARRLIPFSMILPILLGYLGFLNASTTVTGMSYGITLMVLASSLVFSGVILINSVIIEKSEIMRKLSLQNLKRSQTLALKSAEAGTWNWNILHNVMFLDNHVHHLFGIKPGKFPGFLEAIYNYIHPKDRQRVNDEIKASLEKHFEFESEFRVIHTDGSIHNLAARGHIYRDKANRPTSMSGIFWDITHRKQVEEELRSAKEAAEKLAENAEEANRAKSAFLTAMSHEIRTPLNGIMGMIGLLYDTELTHEQREHIETARLSSEELLSVINNILDYSKIESGRMELEVIDFNLQSLIDDTIELHASYVQQKQLAIGAVIEANIPKWLTGDPTRLKQVLSNLLSNAAKFTNKGEISIRVKLAAQEEQEITLSFEVIDTGIGIGPETRNQLFKPFSQGDFSNSRKHGGTGLGLAISKRLVEIMGGLIQVKSYQGKGSKFSFTVKLKECTKPGEIEAKQELIPELRNSRIICVDDNSINREIIKRQVESMQLRCDLASNAGEALSLLKKAIADEDPYDLAIIDCIMPGMDGLELIQVIRQLNEIAKTNVILLSSSEAGFGLDEMKKLNIIMSLTKPLKQSKLHESIVTALQIVHGTEKNIKQNQPLQAPQNAQILLAEDNPVNQQVALGVLNKLGYQTVAVKNGVEAVKAFKKDTYDLILMDCQMPEMDGYAATEKIRQIEKQENKKSIAIIAMTANALKGDREKCLQTGMNDYISKPIDIKLLASMLQKWLINIERRPVKKDPPMIEMQRIHEIFGNDKEAIKLFIKSLVESTRMLLSELEEAVHSQDVMLADNILHRLKGSCGNSGIMQMHGVCLEAEERVKKADWEHVNKLTAALNKLFNQLTDETDNLLNNL